jgi:hypothetical protein
VFEVANKKDSMSAERAAPCRHPGAPPEAVVDKVVSIIASLADDGAYLASRGLTPEEYRRALPAAIQQFRGSRAASTSDRRQFLSSVFNEMRSRGLISNLEQPRYGDDTVYRLTVEGLGDVAVIQKGCPDGAHSSVRWAVPDWAVETYLWWQCPSLTHEPGEHIAKGVNRLRQRFFSEATDALDGIIFHNELCGSADRPCPKMERSIAINERKVPPPCIYVMPEHVKQGQEWNWDGRRKRRFPSVLLSLFDIREDDVATYTGYVGFQKRGGSMHLTITSSFGPGRSTKFRS